MCELLNTHRWEIYGGGVNERLELPHKRFIILLIVEHFGI
jgi:hypothetical protein